MIQKIIDALPLCTTNSCFSASSSIDEGVYDDETSWVKFNNEPRNFTVNNTTQKIFHLLAIDKCCLDHTFVGKRCDFAIIDGLKHFYMVEIKDTARNNYHSQLLRPLEQLENTIMYFRSLNLLDDFEERTAIFCWKANPPVPLVNCSYNAAKLRFFKNYNFSLKEGNSISI